MANISLRFSYKQMQLEIHVLAPLKYLHFFKPFYLFYEAPFNYFLCI